MLGEFNNLLAVGACGGVVTAAEAVTIPLLRRAAIIDVPGHRSSHTVPTPRGGGIPIAAGLPAEYAQLLTGHRGMVRIAKWGVNVTGARRAIP